MVRKHETSMAWKAGLLAVLVHVVLVGILLFSFQWKAAHKVVSVSEVELWDSLPSKSQPLPEPVPQVVEPKVKPEPLKPEPKVEPEPPPKPELKVEPEPKPEIPKVDIELENKKKKEAEQKRIEEEKKKLVLEKERKAEEQRKKQLEAIKKTALEEELETNNKAKEDALKKLQQMNDDDLGSADKKAASAASQGIMDEYVAKIKERVRGRVIQSLCGEGNPELTFKISLLPNGEFSGGPTLTKSSGIPACDDAVERAIIQSEPFELPKDPTAAAMFRNLNLKFRPNGD
jgi:colicin import membrane protein